MNSEIWNYAAPTALGKEWASIDSDNALRLTMSPVPSFFSALGLTPYGSFAQMSAITTQKGLTLMGSGDRNKTNA